MPRPREFDEQHAIEQAMHAFWSNGYEATSTEQLCEATGLGRSSIYNTFTSKHELFRKSLLHYFNTATQEQIDLLDEPGNVRDKIRNLLNRTVADEYDNQHRGCFAVNTLAELAGRDDEVSADLRWDVDRYIVALRLTIESAQRDREIDPAKDSGALARFVHSTIGSLRLMARAGAERAEAFAVVDVAMTAL